MYLCVLDTPRLNYASSCSTLAMMQALGKSLVGSYRSSLCQSSTSGQQGFILLVGSAAVIDGIQDHEFRYAETLGGNTPLATGLCPAGLMLGHSLHLHMHLWSLHIYMRSHFGLVLAVGVPVDCHPSRPPG